MRIKIKIISPYLWALEDWFDDLPYNLHIKWIKFWDWINGKEIEK